MIEPLDIPMGLVCAVFAALFAREAFARAERRHGFMAVLAACVAGLYLGLLLHILKKLVVQA